MSGSNSSAADAAIVPSEARVLADLVAYGEGAVVSRTIARGTGGNLTVFAFSEGQELSEHSTPFDAYVVVLDGEATLIIGGETVTAATGEMVLMPAEIPHAVRADRAFKMMLVMFKNNKD